MIADLKPYPDYRDSGQPWLGGIPACWGDERAKWLFSKKERPVRDDDEVVTCFRDGVVTLRRNRRLRGFTEATVYSGYQGIRKGDLVIHGMDAFAGAIGVSDSDGKGTPVYSVCQPRPGVNARFYAYLLRQMSQSGWILALAKGIRERSTDFRFEMFGTQRVPLPPTEDQAAIVRFLDYANGRLERAIRAKRKVIALLQEQKQVIIHRAVTRGLDPSVPLKPSGISWLGDIPAHWEVQRLRSLVRRIDQGVSPLAAGFLADGDSWGVLKSGCVNRGMFRETEHKMLARGFDIDPSIVVRLGDVLISRACGSPSLVGSVGRVRALRYRLILSDKTFRPHFRDSVDADFMVFAMNSWYYRHQVERAISGAEGMANNLPLSSLRDFSFAVPPNSVEGARIAAAIEAETSGIQAAISRLEREIELLRECRARLTADVVTGKIDVREAARNLPGKSYDSGESAADQCEDLVDEEVAAE